MGSAQTQGDYWGRRADDWAQLQEPLQEPYYRAVFDALGLAPGARLLDVGCGSGYALALAADRGARTTGLDAAAPLIEIAHGRVPSANLQVGELQELPYEDDSFDVVTSFNAVQYASDPVAAVAEARRVTAAGGHVAIVTWGAPQRCEYRAVLAAIGSLLPPPPAGSPGPFALSEPGALESLIESAGITTVRVDDVATPFHWDEPDTAYRACSSSGPAARAIEHAGEDAFRAAIAPVLEAHRRPDGRIRFDNQFRYAVGKR